MKKLLLLNVGIVSLISLFSCQNSATPVKKNSATPLVKTGWEDDGLKGKVKFFTESPYGAEDRFGEIQKTNLSSKKTYKYDDKGNEIEVCSYESGILFMTEIYEYKFDQYGNWIKKSSFENQIPKNIYERKYEYYE